MNFTDEDLKQLKEMLIHRTDEIEMAVRVKDWKALITRLEATEKALERYHELTCDDDAVQAYEEWRKAAGK